MTAIPVFAIVIGMPLGRLGWLGFLALAIAALALSLRIERGVSARSIADVLDDVDARPAPIEVVPIAAASRERRP
jgi:hypothetical protein